MNNADSESDRTKKLSTSIWIVGLLLAVLGAVGILLPALLSFAVEIFLAWIMIVGGILFGYYNYQVHLGWSSEDYGI